MKAAIELADIDDTAHTKKPSSRYLSPRSGMSSHRHIRKLRPKTRFPACHRYSKSVPTGQSQLQNALRNRNAMDANVSSKNIAAGCMLGTWPLNSQYLKFIMPAIGNHPSTPAGRAMSVD